MQETCLSDKGPLGSKLVTYKYYSGVVKLVAYVYCSTERVTTGHGYMVRFGPILFLHPGHLMTGVGAHD